MPKLVITSCVARILRGEMAQPQSFSLQTDRFCTGFANLVLQKMVPQISECYIEIHERGLTRGSARCLLVRFSLSKQSFFFDMRGVCDKCVCVHLTMDVCWA